MGAPIHAPGMRGATVHWFEAPGVRESAPVRAWRATRPMSMPIAGWFAFWQPPSSIGHAGRDIQIAYAGNHPADIPAAMWRDWFGAAHDMEFWNAARRELRITNHPPPGTVH